MEGKSCHGFAVCSRYPSSWDSIIWKKRENKRERISYVFLLLRRPIHRSHKHLSTRRFLDRLISPTRYSPSTSASNGAPGGRLPALCIKINELLSIDASEPGGFFSRSCETTFHMEESSNMSGRERTRREALMKPISRVKPAKRDGKTDRSAIKNTFQHTSCGIDGYLSSLAWSLKITPRVARFVYTQKRFLLNI